MYKRKTERRLTQEHKDKISKAHIGKKKGPMSDKHKRKISLGGKGKKRPPRSEEHRKNMSKAQMGRKAWNIGLTKADERVRKYCWNSGNFKKGQHSSLKTEFKKGDCEMEKNSNWQNGKSFEPYNTDWTKTLRRAIRERDNYVCQLCNKLQGDKTFHVHHIDYDKKNNDPHNLITLCCSCNIKVNYNREYWVDYFQELMIRKIINNT